MISGLIRWSIRNRLLVLLATGFVVAWGIYSVQQTPVDALPDLSDVQVIVKTSFPGQAPQVVEDQVTYPLTTAMLSVPKAVTVRLIRTAQLRKLCLQLGKKSRPSQVKRPSTTAK